MLALYLIRVGLLIHLGIVVWIFVPHIVMLPLINLIRLPFNEIAALFQLETSASERDFD